MFSMKKVIFYHWNGIVHCNGIVIKLGSIKDSNKHCYDCNGMGIKLGSIKDSNPHCYGIESL